MMKEQERLYGLSGIHARGGSGRERVVGAEFAHKGIRNM